MQIPDPPAPRFGPWSVEVVEPTTRMRVYPRGPREIAFDEAGHSCLAGAWIGIGRDHPVDRGLESPSLFPVERALQIQDGPAAIALATRQALAMMVSVGLLPAGVGKLPPSTTYRLGTSCARQLRSRTEVAGSSPIRVVPC